MNLYPDMSWFYGVVEDNNDPLKLGRLRVRIIGHHTHDIELIPKDSLPWAQVIQSITSSANSGIGNSPTGILHGTWVVGFFADGGDMQQPIIMGTLAGVPQKISNPKIGFNDPDGVYPLTEMDNDVHELARNQESIPVSVADKKKNQDKDISTAAGITWTEPNTTWNPVYPNNHTKTTKSGHIEEFDDTEALERINREHKTGTFVEWHPDGTQVKKIVGDQYEIIAKDNNILIKGKCNVTINGDANVKVLGNATTEISGNQKTTVEKDILLTAIGKIEIIATKDLILKGKTIQEN